ncbi:TIGR00366 family protein [Bacteriovorax sp. BSW11_IV]|uniref:short-chain fatty acid transporter n=1 Tax=Bacteriovorax sp. BSW11_IV TaxID=1353529 RepID=UPI00038A3569|nr:short-chain fatty acid transporter [Bacteriovorax sp. BSW11_IV]EQC50098.1 TIGR00366 family protein [Bacteriovorax sp. BSW11_IV]
MSKKQKSIFDRMIRFSVRIVNEFLPDPFIFCALLTFIVFLSAPPVTGMTPIDAITGWYSGFWNLLAFSMQMVLVLVLGHAMANSGPFSVLLAKMASTLKTPAQSIIAVSFISLIASWFNWGFGLVIGAIFAKEIAKKVKGVDYRLLIASAYTGFLVWHGGLSGSIPLTIATEGNLAKITQNTITGTIDVAETLFSMQNIVILIILLFTVPLLNCFMHPKEVDTVVVDPELLKEHTPKMNTTNTWADRMENSKLISGFLALMGLVFIGQYFYTKGLDLNLNIVNFIFLFIGIILHKTPKNYIQAIRNAVVSSSGIILQFPFYAGIMGIMVAKGPEGISLAGALSNFFVSISTPQTFPFFTFLSAGIVNFFVPSGGGQWAVQAPIMLPAAKELGVSVAKTSMAISWGDAWTNMIQPFWALPALGIAGLGARDIMGYCLIILVYSGVVISAAMLVL